MTLSSRTMYDSDEWKLSFRTLGPFRVISNDGNTIVLDYDGVVQRVSSDRVTPVLKPDDCLKPNDRTRVLPSEDIRPPSPPLDERPYHEPARDVVPPDPVVRNANEPELEPDPQRDDDSEVEYVI